MAVSVKTKRLEIKPFSDADQEAMAALLQNVQIKKTYMIPDFEREEEAIRLFRRFRELSLSDGRYVAGIYLDGGLIGFLNDVENDGNRIELGYVIDPRYHNCGYATEALKGVIADLFEKGYSQVVAGAFESNAASIKVMIKSGMTKIAQEEDVEYRGAVHHCVYYSIDR